MNYVDIFIVVLLAVYGLSGYRNGVITGALSLGGFLGGAVLGAQLAHPIGREFAHGSAQVWTGVGVVVAVALFGQLLGVLIAARLRRHLTWRPAQTVDAVLGLLLSCVGVLLVSWMLAVPLASSPLPSLSREVRQSEVVHGVDAVVPGPVRHVYSSLRDLVDRSGFPEVFGALQPSQILAVDPPDPSLPGVGAVTRASASVVKIVATGGDCGHDNEGSGFVYADGRVMTNAHVVAGMSSVTVQAPGSSQALQATVVVFDPDRDVAVLAVSGLQRPALTFAAAAVTTGTDAVVVGYPEDGPRNAQAARIRDRQSADGENIYGDPGQARDIYSVRSLVRPGNSGGPLLNVNGQVLGVVFATAVDSADTGYALTDAEVAPDAVIGRSATEAVNTRSCA